MKKIFSILPLMPLLFGFHAEARVTGIMGGLGLPGPVQGINIASGVRAPGYDNSGPLGGTNTTQNMESQHTNESGQTLTQLSVIYSGWLVTFTNGNEAANPNLFTVTASIEYPLGTFNQVTWNGRTSLLVAPGANIVSDYINLSTPIPAGAVFYVRTFVSVPIVGYSWPSSGALANNDVGEIGVGLADKTMGGTISGTTQGYRPSAILAPQSNFPSLISVAGIGDSIVAGATDTGFDGHGNKGWLGRSCSGRVPFINMAVTGTTLANQQNRFTYRPDLLQKAGITHAVMDYGVNDVVNSPSLSTLESQAGALISAINNVGVKAVYATITPRSTDTTSTWYQTSTQTAFSGFGGGSSSVRAQFNAWLRTKPAPLYDFVENSWTLESSPDNSIWNVNPSANTSSLAPQDSWTISGTPTTTQFQSNSTRSSTGSSYYAGGSILFTSGVNNGVFTSIGSYSSVNGTFNVPALASAPSAGDTFIAYPVDMKPSSDGLHPVGVLNPNTGSYHGGIPILMNNFIPQLAGWR